jgi:cobyrinic acid a,c-diamide synthase
VVNVPRLVVAAPASGHGKTTVATGLMAALAARGLVTSGHKAGPDYIDPGYHALATGRPARNLDPVLCGEGTIAPLFFRGAAGADIAVVEGVMGLFDGRGATAEGSTAHVARLLDAPVVLVVDAAAQGRSVAALVSGFASFDPGVRLAGVILNRVGSARHEEILRAALAGIGMPVLGALRRDEGIAAPSRHLGLVPAAERDGAARQAIARLAALVTESVDLAAVVALARTADPLSSTPWDPAAALAGSSPASVIMTSVGLEPHQSHDHDRSAGGGRSVGGMRGVRDARGAGGAGGMGARPVVAIAAGAAFTFCYTETVELLTAAGADVVTVDPLRDEALPPGSGALILGGGFPEVHAGDLSGNEPLRADVARLARSGAPVVAECAGLLYLARELDGLPMCGVIDAAATMTPRLTLGYRDAVAAGPSVLTPAGTAVRGHEFHRTTMVAGRPAAPAWSFGGKEEGFVRAGVHASYLHLHWAGCPGLARRVVAAMRHPLSTAGSGVTPQPPGRTPQSAGRRASGTTQPQAPLRCPGGEDTPPAPQSCAPPARPSEAPAREAMK